MHETTAQLFDELEREARARSEGLEAFGKLPGPKRNPPLGFTERHYPLTLRETLELRRLKAAAASATDVDVFVALVRGEAVPVSRLSRRVVEQHYAGIANGR